MKILITADPEIPVPPKLYGGIERVIDILIDGLVERGHQPTLIAHPDSTPNCPLVPYPAGTSQGKVAALKNMWTVSHEADSGQYDIVHSFGRVLYLLPIISRNIPKLMTYQRLVTLRNISLGHKLSRGTLHFSAISEHMISEVRELGDWHVVPNGVDLAKFDFILDVPADAPLVFLGRIEHIKGTHLAIEIAKAAGRRLIIAGNIEPEHQEYFDGQVAPHLDGERITYIGPVDDQQKNALLGSAAAFLMPILWEEPFGIVMAEALACGTPVIGTRRGSVPEIVDESVTGFVCDTVEDMVSAVDCIDAIQRSDCRKVASHRYSTEAVVNGYLDVYPTVCQQSGQLGGNK